MIDRDLPQTCSQRRVATIGAPARRHNGWFVLWETYRRCNTTVGNNPAPVLRAQPTLRLSHRFNRVEQPRAARDALDIVGDDVGARREHTLGPARDVRRHDHIG